MSKSKRGQSTGGSAPRTPRPLVEYIYFFYYGRCSYRQEKYFNASQTPHSISSFYYFCIFLTNNFSIKYLRVKRGFVILEPYLQKLRKFAGFLFFVISSLHPVDNTSCEYSYILYINILHYLI